MGNTRRVAERWLLPSMAALAIGLVLLAGFRSPVSAVPVTPGANLDYDAALDDGANTVWENTGTTSGRNITNLTNYTFVTPTTSLPGITKAYSFAAGGGDLQTLDGLGNGQSASFEMWFRPTDLTGDQRLFETGGGNGVGITLGGGTQVPGQTSSVFFSVTQNSGGTQTARVSSDLSGVGVTEFIQVVGTFDATGNGTSALYVNGIPVGTNAAAAAITDWSGGDNGGVGVLGGSNQGGYGNGAMGFTDYNGEIAIFRFYQNKLLTSSEVAQNYHAIAGSPTDVFFDNDSADNAWETDTNWGPEPGLQPSATQNAYIGNSLTATITQPGEAAAEVIVGHNQATLPGGGTLTLNDPNASLTATRLRIGTGGQNGTVDFVTGTMTLTGTSSDQSLYVGQSSGSNGIFTMGTLGGNDADTTLIYNGGRFEVAKDGGSTGTFTLNSGTVTGTQNFIVTQSGATANVFIHGGSFTTTTDMNFNSGNGTYLQDGGTVSVRTLNQSNVSGKASIITVDGGTLTVNANLDDRNGSSTINLGGTGRLELVGNNTTRETDDFNQSGTGALKMMLYNGTTGVSAPLNVKTLGTFAGTPTIELENQIPANAATIVDWVDGTDTWDANPVGKWAGDVLPSNGANTILTGTAITVITSPNNMTNPGVLSSGTAGWTVDATDPKAIKMVVTGNPVGGPATARIQGASSIVTRNADLHIAPELGTDAAGLVLGSGASLTLTGASTLTVGGGTLATIDHDGGTLTIGGDLLFGGSFGNQGGTYNLNGGALNVAGDIIEGDSGAPSSGVNNAQLMINGGTLGAAGGITVQRFSIGEAASSVGAAYTIPVGQDVYSTGSTVVGSQGTNASLTVNGTLTADGTSWVAEKADSSGTLTVNPGASVTMNDTWEIGDAAGADGSVILNGGTVTVKKGWIQATNATATATLTVEDGAVLNVSGGNFETAASGTGKAVWHGGTLNQTNNNVIVGQNSGSDATFEVYGGTLNIANQLRITNKVDVGGQFLLYGGTVNVGSQMDTFNTAGTNTTGFATIVVDDTHAGSNAPAVLDVGTHLVLGNTNVTGGTTQMDLVSGTVTVGGNLELATGGAGLTSIFNLSGGTLDMTGGNIVFGAGTATFNFTGGALKDCANFGSSLDQQGGILAPGGPIGTTRIEQNYLQQVNGILAIEIDGAVPSTDLLIVGGAATLNGELSVEFLNPAGPGSMFSILQAGSVNGVFANLPDGAVFAPTGSPLAVQIEYRRDEVILHVLPEPATMTLLALGGLGLIVRRRKRR